MKSFPYFSTKTILLAVFLSFNIACQSPQVSDSRPSPLPQQTNLQVYFNHNLARDADYQEPYRNIRRNGDDLERVIVDGINSARASIDIAVQEFNLPRVALALAERQKTGIKIRVIVEHNYRRPLSTLTTTEVSQLKDRERNKYRQFFEFVDRDFDGKLSFTEINERDAMVILQNAKIPIIDDTADRSKGSGLMHHKFMVIDGKTVITGSANWTTSDVHGDIDNLATRGNTNNLLKIDSSELAKLFSDEFNLMWGDGVGGKSDSKFGLDKPARNPQQVKVGNSLITVSFAPSSEKSELDTSGNNLIITTLDRANKNINLALFVFSDQNIANKLERKQQQQVKISALVDREFAFRDYSEVMDMLGVALSNNCQYEVNNRPWQNIAQNVGTVGLPLGDKLHHKFAVVDNKTVITGSHNWSDAADRLNDETLLVIDSPELATHFDREFNNLYNKATIGVPSRIQEKIATDIKQCATIAKNKIKINQQTHTNGGLINLNTATQAELESLPGIGKKTAINIIEARRQKPFRSLEDLDRVSGIGEKTLQQLQGKVTW
jgi:competence ComEA-like helix-hairpin-helix protein